MHLVSMKGAVRFAARNWIGVSTICIALALPAGPRAQAGPITFAQFTQQNPGANNFVYTNNGASPGGAATFDTIGGGNPIFLTVDPTIVPAGFPVLQSATLTLTSSTTTPATLNVGPNTLREPFPITTNTMDIVLAVPFGGQSNFLSVTFSATADGLTGSVGSSSGGFKGSDAAAVPDAVSYTSDFINFTGTTEHSFALSFTSITSTPGGLQRDPVNNLFASFTASGTGTFDTNFAPAVVPEPPTVALAGLGLTSLLGWWWRCKKHAVA